MNTSDIEYMWKVATNDPNHDTNWYDPVVVAFAKLVANHTMANIDPSSFMSYQEGYAAGIEIANKRHCEALRALHDTISLQAKPNTLKPRNKP